MNPTPPKHVFALQPTRKTGRERIIAVMFFVVLFTFAARLVQLQVVEHSRWYSLAQGQMLDRARESMPRGEIRDRSGLPLAVTLPLSYAVGFRPHEGIDRDFIAAELGRYLPYPDSMIRTKMERSTYTYLARLVDWQVKQDIDSLHLPGIEFVKEARRSYPATTAASTVVGFSNVDGVGLSGIELSLDSLLCGDRREMVVWNDARRAVPAVMSPLDDDKAHSGANVFLTIDLELQSILDRSLAQGLDGRTYERACAVLMDPFTGEVLGLSTLPTFDPNAYSDYSNGERRCWPVTDLFEPGSIFKIVTVSAGLEEGVVTPSTMIDCEGGAYRVPGKVLHDAHSYGVLSLAEVFAKSSNIGCAKVAERLRAETFYSWIQKFGFGTKTDVGLAAEPSGLVPKPANWSGPTRSNLAIGQGVSVTALQIAAAYSAIANGGMLMQPKLIKALEFPTGELVSFDPVALRPVMSKEHAQEMTRLMQQVVEHGTGGEAKIEGVAIAGKTGTAQKVNLEAKTYYSNRYVSSFAGFFPADHPRYVLLVVVDDPRGSGYYGGQISAPVFASIAREILEERHSYLLPKPTDTDSTEDVKSKANDEPDSSKSGEFAFDTTQYVGIPLVDVPNVIGLPLRLAAGRMQDAGLTATLTGNGIVVSQFPPAGERIPKTIVCQVTAQPKTAAQYAASN
ncbi:MAG: PASTA domain-containing protein [Calditrichaeota bacterium]|nr:PASTA domain-containing protein [Calditrichota bacterium]MCB9391066.1 PASTA domain-containing protein [Calditrichota bacterium]